MISKTAEEYLGIIIDYSRDALIPEQGLALLTGKGFYKKEWEVSPQQGLARASTGYCFGDYEFAQRIYDYASKGFFTFAGAPLINAVETSWPTFSNEEFDKAGYWLECNVEPTGMPINCFLSYIPDTKEGLVDTRTETNWLSMLGGGIGIYAGNRSPDSKSTGAMAHMRGYDADALSYKQTESKRGSIAAYMDITHPEIKSFIQSRNPVGGDQNKKCFNLHNAVNLTDDFMQKVILEKDYELIDPKHGKTGRFLNARETFEEILEQRYETGEPYIMFKDTVNRGIPKWITHPLYNVEQSNLCSEIVLRTSATRTAVCCLSSLNLEKYDEWKDTNMVEDLVRLLDNILEYFIRLAPPVLKRAVNSASKERALGLGTLGWHSYLQSKGIPFESGGYGSAIQKIHILYKDIHKKGIAASLMLGKERGESYDCLGSGMRNSHIFAIAPNANSSSRVGTSPSKEPWNSNAFNATGRSGSYLIKNKFLEPVLESYGKNTPEVWKSIILNQGSVQHLPFLSEDEKKVFKTFVEIDPMWVIEHAAEIQNYICQSQSTNIKVPKGISKQKMIDIHMSAYFKKVKTLYYCRAESPNKASLNFTEELEGECLGCGG
jgi:ribonucleoside-diphosphate reductase alpha chain